MADHWARGEKGTAFPVQDGEVWRVGRHVFVCSDLMASTRYDETVTDLVESQPWPVPVVVYSDPPWGQSLANGFRTKAGLPRATYQWTDLYTRIARIAQERPTPWPLWLECSTESSRDGQQVRNAIMHPSSPYYAYVETTYYGKKPMGLYVASPRAVPQGLLSLLSGMDDNDTPRMVLAHYDADGPGVVLDPCTGLGQTPWCAEKRDWHSLNNEISPFRMSAAMARMSEVTGSAAERIDR